MCDIIALQIEKLPVSFAKNICRSDGMVDVADSKSAEGNLMGVRVPPSAPKQTSQTACFFVGE